MAIRKCSECEFAKFADGNGNPNRYYCEHKNARFARSKCEPVPMICRTDRHSREFTIKTSPKWCPIRNIPVERNNLRA